MSYTYLQDQEEEFSAECFSDIPLSVQLSWLPLGEKLYYKDNEMGCFLVFPFGMTLEPLMPNLGEIESIFSVLDFLAKESHRLGATQLSMETIQGYMEEAQNFGKKFQKSLANLGIQTSLLKTPKLFCIADSVSSFEHLPPLGIIVNGVCLGLAISAPTMNESVCGSRLPTPTEHNGKEGNYPAERTRNTPTLAAQVGGKINPNWQEQRMGWPIKWTDLEPLEMDKFLMWLQRHLDYSHSNK